MKKNRWLHVLLGIAVFMSVTACSAEKKEEPPKETESVEQEAERPEEQPVEPEETPASEEAEEAVPEEGSALLNVRKTSVGRQYSGSREIVRGL